MSNSSHSVKRDVINGLVVTLHESTNDLVTATQQFPDDLFNRSIENKWSAGQILMHLVLTESAVSNLLIGPSETIKRDPTEKHNTITEGLANRSRFINAPLNLQPRPTMYGKTELLKKFTENRIQFEELLESEEMGNSFANFAHPFFGELSGVEWIHFILQHSSRHLMQLNKLKESLSQLSNV